ncbi:hypothetical protein [Duncaniella freteri]|jgi:hypothetical protein|nr:hypothetical protein [Duncaniella freteri]
MGCIGMSRNDFEECTPSEFSGIYEAWSHREERLERGRWERTRMECLCLLQPYSKRTLKPKDVMNFPWDNPKDDSAAGSGTDETREEIMTRYREAKRAYGL